MLGVCVRQGYARVCGGTTKEKETVGVSEGRRGGATGGRMYTPLRGGGGVNTGRGA